MAIGRKLGKAQNSYMDMKAKYSAPFLRAMSIVIFVFDMLLVLVALIIKEVILAIIIFVIFSGISLFVYWASTTWQRQIDRNKLDNKSLGQLIRTYFKSLKDIFRK